ncbi:MAG TPA: helix-turn-helix transcriptional regulator [Solirubrobacteraceae bacterium]|jgi:transcriptional regulator with XRE-family HTH domain
MPRTARSDPTAKLIGETIRRARREAGLTQAQLAARLEATAPYVTNVEAGRANLTVGQLASIATALDAVIDLELRLVEREPLRVRRAERSRRSAPPTPLAGGPDRPKKV